MNLSMHLYTAANLPIKTKYKSPYIYMIPNWILRPLVH